jgi:hypothetical protein
VYEILFFSLFEYTVLTTNGRQQRSRLINELA